MVDRHAEIGGLVVAEDQRGCGIGHLLMTEAEQSARRRDCTADCAHSNVDREAAHQFYRKLGYDQVKAQGVFRKAVIEDIEAVGRLRFSSGEEIDIG